MHFREKLARRAKKAGITVSDDVNSRLEAFFDLLRRWNRKVSLTSLPVDDLGDEAIDRLLIEPLIALRYLPRSTRAVMDVGTGGGSPAIPLKVASPAISMRMVESKARKAAFLREVIRTLELEDAAVESTRFEQLLSRPELHEAVDVITMRAVRAEPKTLLGLQAFLKPGGLLFLFRSGTPVEASPAGSMLVMRESHPLLPALNSHLWVLEKVQ